ncbi:MAG: lipopolysaccharide heptosyltransferase II [Deltaproteobacteria bacterium]|nr:lipopolysaccharide heptosyltransferase II [Deltaproteobacteria bacterium]
MNILIVKLSAIGDVIHTLPSLTALRKLYPKAHITWVVEEMSADLIKDHPLLDRVLVSHRTSWIKEMKRGRIIWPLLEMAVFVKSLRERRYDLVIDFHGLLKSAVIVGLSGGKRKLGYNSMQEMSGIFLNEKIPEDMNKHAVDRYLDFPRHLGAGEIKTKFLVPIKEENRTRVEKLLNAHQIDPRAGFVAVNPVALWETKLWENKNFSRLCDRIHEESGLDVVFTGSGKKELEEIQALMKRPSVNLGGETTLKDLAWLYKQARLVITTDTGPMHLAAAVGTPVIALFGPTAPARTGPYGEGHTIIRRDLPCSPCFKKKCKTKECMKEITVEQVWETVRNRISAGRAD